MFWPVLTRGLQRQFRALGGRKLPLIAGHKLLYRCNLECDMCPFWRRPDEELLSVEAERRLLSKLADGGVLFVGFEGGEPLLRPDLPQILREANERFHTSLVTNGFLLSRRLPEFARYLDYLFVSLDGIGPLHDQLRGISGSFDRAVRGIATARERLPVAISATLTRHNLHQATKLVDLAQSLKVAVNFQIAYDYTTAGPHSPNGPALRTTLETLRRRKQAGAPIVNSRAYFDSVLRSWFDAGEPWECRPWLTINLDPAGNIVLPCYVLNQYGGERSVWNTDITELWASIDWGKYATCNRCALSCYLEPSLFRWTDPVLVKQRILDSVVHQFRSGRAVAPGTSASPV